MAEIATRVRVGPGMEPERLEVGKAGVNKHGGIDPMVPFGGAKWSGIGYQFGRWGLETYAALQVIELDRT
jgi:acyl-CoA reductase-like NAD-dependent aldehyde dehydrogenase